MEITTNPEVIAAIAFTSNAVVSVLKRVPALKRYIGDIAIVVPAVFSLIIAFMANYGLESQIMTFISLGGTAYMLSQAAYKLKKI